MRLIEVLLEGVPSAKGVMQYRFEPGLNPWKQKGTFAITTIVDVVESLLYPVTRENEPLGPARSRRAGMTFEARNATYRLVRDFSSKRTVLSQLLPGPEEQFRELSSELRFITETLSRSIRIPSRRVFRSLYVACPGKFRVETARMSEFSEHFSMPPDPQGRLRALRAERENFRRTENAGTRIDELQTEVFRIDEELRKLMAPREEARRIEREYETYRVFDREGLITPQVLAKLDAAGSLVEKRAQDLRALEEKAQQWTAELTGKSERPWWKEPLVWGGFLVTLASLIAATQDQSWLGTWVPLSVAGILSAGLGGLKNFKRAERIRETRAKIKNLDVEKAGIEKRFEIESATVKNVCTVVGEKNPQEILAMVERWKDLSKERKMARERLRETEERVPEEKLRRERDHLAESVSRLEEEQAQVPPSSVDPNFLDRKIQELEGVVEKAEPSLVSMKTAESGAADPIYALLEAAGEAAGKKTLELLALCQKAIDANLVSATGRKFTGIQITGSGFSSLIPVSGVPVSWPELDAPQQALAHFCVQFTLWQLLASLRPMPFVVDLVSAPADDATTKITLSASRYLAKKAQVVVLAP